MYVMSLSRVDGYGRKTKRRRTQDAATDALISQARELSGTEDRRELLLNLDHNNQCNHDVGQSALTSVTRKVTSATPCCSVILETARLKAAKRLRSVLHRLVAQDVEFARVPILCLERWMGREVSQYDRV